MTFNIIKKKILSLSLLLAKFYAEVHLRWNSIRTKGVNKKRIWDSIKFPKDPKKKTKNPNQKTLILSIPSDCNKTEARIIHSFKIFKKNYHRT